MVRLDVRVREPRRSVSTGIEDPPASGDSLRTRRYRAHAHSLYRRPVTEDIPRSRAGHRGHPSPVAQGALEHHGPCVWCSDPGRADILILWAACPLDGMVRQRAIVSVD